MDVNFLGKRIIVTGAASGIGRQVAIHLTKCGATVIALDIDKENLETLKTDFPSIEIAAVDLTDWDATDCAVKSVYPVDFLVNNAGNAIITAVADITEDIFYRNFDTHVKSTVNVTKLVVRNLLERKVPGAIVNISSIASKSGLPSPGGSLYAACKGAIESFTISIASELGQNNIRVNSVNPTFIRTKLTEHFIDEMRDQIFERQSLKRFAVTQDVANAVAFLLSDNANSITGSALPVDCGYITH